MDRLSRLLDDMAEDIAQAASADSVPLVQKIDAFKALAAHAAAMVKKPVKSRDREPEDEDGADDYGSQPDFRSMRKRIGSVA